MSAIRCSVVTYNNQDTIEACIDSLLLNSPGTEVRITVVDNNSDDDTTTVIKRRYPEVELIQPGENLGFAAGQNLVLRQTREKSALVINPDAKLAQGALATLERALRENSDVALVAPRVEYENNRPQLSFGALPGLLVDWRQRKLQKALQSGRSAAVKRLTEKLKHPFFPDWVSASCFLARMADLTAIDFFDQGFFLYMEDVDLCCRLRSVGKRVMVDPSALCRHIEGHSQKNVSLQKYHYRKSRLLYENKHGRKWRFHFYKFLRGSGIDRTWDPAIVFKGGNN